MEKNEQKSRSKSMYAVSTFLVLVVLVIGVTMVNNYDKMQGIKSTLEKLNGGIGGKEEVVETLGTIVDKKEEDGREEEKQPEEPDDDKESPTGPEKPQDNTETEKPQENPNTDTETPQEPQISEQPDVPAEPEIYIVEKGDTLASISQKIYGDISHVNAICQKNGLEDGNLILIGQKLLLP